MRSADQKYSTVAASTLAVVLLAIVRVIIHPRLRLTSQLPRDVPCSVQSNDPATILAEANHLYALSNLWKAEPLYAHAEAMFCERGDRRDELYAKVGMIRCKAETQSFDKISEFLAGELKRPLVRKDPELRLWCLAAKGMTDIEINRDAAGKDWERVRIIAGRLEDNNWEARADGELGLIAFLKGDGRKAAWMVGSALLSAKANKDVAA